MAASNYMTEADTESIWATTLDTTRFGKIGVRIAEILNFEIMNDATSQITTAAVLPILEHLSEEGLILLIASAKVNALHDPYEFMISHAISVMDEVLGRNQRWIKKIKKVLNQTESVEFKDIGGLGASSEI